MLTIAANVATLSNWDARKNPDDFAFLSNLKRKFVQTPDVSTRIGGQGKVSTVSKTRDPSRAMPMTMAQPRARVYMRTRGAHRKEGMDRTARGGNKRDLRTPCLMVRYSDPINQAKVSRKLYRAVSPLGPCQRNVQHSLKITAEPSNRYYLIFLSH